jgi:hypothetical protein
MRQTLVKSVFAPTFVPSGIVTSAMKAKALMHAGLLVAEEAEDAVDAEEAEDELGGGDETDDADDALAVLVALLELACAISCDTLIEIAAGSLVAPAELYARTMIV